MELIDETREALKNAEANALADWESKMGEELTDREKTLMRWAFVSGYGFGMDWHAKMIKRIENESITNRLSKREE